MTFPRALARYTHGAVNNMTLHLAGHTAFADVEHVGRKSGIVRHTPVRAFRVGDTVIIGLNFGRPPAGCGSCAQGLAERNGLRPGAPRRRHRLSQLGVPGG